MSTPNGASPPADRSPLDRYSRQVIYREVGPEAQARLRASRVVLVGCGALGSVLADTLVRAGVGHLRIIDRDYVELSNLQRQVLFTEEDAAEPAPKAVAAAQCLSGVNRDVVIEPVVADVHAGNIEGLLAGAGLLLDGSDNFEVRFLMNDAAVKHGLPWVYGACVGAEGMVMPILPGETACLRCIWQEAPPPGTGQTCDTAGVLGPIVHIVAALQAMEAMKILFGRRAAVCRSLVQVNAWTGEWSRFDQQSARAGQECPCCGQGRYDYLSAAASDRTAGLCGRNAVQVPGVDGAEIDLEALSAKIAPVAKSPPRRNRYLLRFDVDDYEITVFRDGRAIIRGTNQPEEARSVYARYIGA